MRLDFPDTPADGEDWLAPTGVTYRWNATKGVWTTVNIPSGSGGGGGATGSLNYSMDEQDTGIRFIDSRPILQKSVQLNSITAGVSTTPHGIARFGWLVSISVVFRETSGTYWFEAPFTDPANEGTLGVWVQPTQIQVNSAIARPGVAYATLRYTKLPMMP